MMERFHARVLIHSITSRAHSVVTERDRVVIENTRSRVKIKSKLINIKNNSLIEGYNGKYGSNPQGIREILKDLFEFDQIGQ